MDPSQNYSTPPPTPTKLEIPEYKVPANETSLLRTKEESTGCISKHMRRRYGIPSMEGVPTNAKDMAKFLFEEIKQNWKAGITVSLVSVPLSISLAIASEATPVMGIVTAIWAGGMAAAFGGSHFNIMGPTGALSGILALYALEYGLSVLPFLALLTGLLCLIVYVLRIDSYFMFIPSAVVHGFTLGVAFIIALNQLNFAFGLHGLHRHEEFYKNVFESFRNLPNANGWAVGTFLVAVVTLLTLVRKVPKVPWVIILAIVGMILGAIIQKYPNFPIKIDTLMSLYPKLELSLFHIPEFKSEFLTFSVLTAAISVAFIAILETLISAKIADRMTNTSFSQPREILGVGVANIFCGLFGGLPATAALARTALNVKSGATSRTSGVINAIMIACISFIFLPFFTYLVMPVIAAILVQVAVRMVEFDHITHMWHHDKKMFWLLILTALVCIFDEPTSGIVFGAIIGLLMFASYNAVGHGDLAIQKGKRLLSEVSAQTVDEETMDDLLALKGDGFGDTLVYRIPGDLTYLNSPSHTDRAKKIPARFKTIILSLRHLFYVDFDGLDALTDMVNQWESDKRRVIISGTQAPIRDQLHHSKWFKNKEAAGLVYTSYREAIASLTETDSMRMEDTRSHSYFEELA